MSAQRTCSFMYYYNCTESRELLMTRSEVFVIIKLTGLVLLLWTCYATGVGGGGYQGREQERVILWCVGEFSPCAHPMDEHMGAYTLLR